MGVSKVDKYGLSEKQQNFVREYIKDFCGTKAAIRAGYSKRSANEQASRMLAKDNVQKKIADLTKKLEEKQFATKERVMQELARIAFFDPRKLFNDDGALKSVSDLDEDTAAVVANLEIEELFAGRGEEREAVGHLKKVKMWDKMKGLEMLAKHFKIYSDAPMNVNEFKFGYGPEKPV